MERACTQIGARLIGIRPVPHPVCAATVAWGVNPLNLRSLVQSALVRTTDLNRTSLHVRKCPSRTSRTSRANPIHSPMADTGCDERTIIWA